MPYPMTPVAPTARIGERPGRILMIVGAALALVLMVAALILPALGAGAGAVLKLGLWLLAGYALVGAAVALTVTLRAAKTHRRIDVSRL